MKGKEIYWSVLLLLLVICATGTAQERETTKRVVVIDAGHGGIDSGVVSKDVLLEKDIVLDIAHGIRYWNRELFDNGLDIYLTRDGDTLISLSDRTGLSRVLEPDLFVSLHCNHSDNVRARGVEAYVYHKKGRYSEVSEQMAGSMLNGIAQKLGFAQRGLKEANFQVLRDNSDICPAVLLELGFLSRKEESGYLGENSGRLALALVILDSVYWSLTHFD